VRSAEKIHFPIAQADLVLLKTAATTAPADVIDYHLRD
jgi:hypothetical protein